MYNEMFADDRSIRGPYDKVSEWINASGVDLLKLRQSEAEAIFRKIGITFAVYGEGGDPERLIPFDLLPRIFTAAEWRNVWIAWHQASAAAALNAFIHDVYHRGEIMFAPGLCRPRSWSMADSRPILAEMVGNFDAAGQGVQPHCRHRHRAHRPRHRFQVLEDNCRTPSGVSYMLENREIMMRMFPQLFQRGHRRERR